MKLGKQNLWKKFKKLKISQAFLKLKGTTVGNLRKSPGKYRGVNATMSSRSFPPFFQKSLENPNFATDSLIRIFIKLGLAGDGAWAMASPQKPCLDFFSVRCRPSPFSLPFRSMYCTIHHVVHYVAEIDWVLFELLNFLHWSAALASSEVACTEWITKFGIGELRSRRLWWCVFLVNYAFFISFIFGTGVVDSDLEYVAWIAARFRRLGSSENRGTPASEPSRATAG